MEKIALVTGASRGIGRAVAAELAHRGWAVAIGYRVRRDKAEELAAASTAEGCRAMIVPGGCVPPGGGGGDGPHGGGHLRARSRCW